MNIIRQLSRRAARNVMKRPTPQRLTPTFQSRFLRRNFSPMTRSRMTVLRRKPTPFVMPSRKFSSVFGASVIGTFIKTSVVFYGIPITAAASPYFNTLPFDALYGCILPYHAYVGMAHIATGTVYQCPCIKTAISQIINI